MEIADSLGTCKRVVRGSLSAAYHKVRQWRRAAGLHDRLPFCVVPLCCPQDVLLQFRHEFEEKVCQGEGRVLCKREGGREGGASSARVGDIFAHAHAMRCSRKGLRYHVLGGGRIRRTRCVQPWCSFVRLSLPLPPLSEFWWVLSLFCHARIRMADGEASSISIYGFSYGFPWEDGQHEHNVSADLCRAAFPSDDVSWSAEGY